LDKPIDERNSASLERLRALSATLSEEELSRPIDPPWTAAALFAHIAFWDRFVHLRWATALDSGGREPVSIDDEAMELVNGAGLPQWLRVPPRDATNDCLEAGAAVNQFIASLPPDVVSEVIASGRPRLVNRSIHRNEHLRTLEAAFGAG
jgi:hypothetical protein